MINNPVTVTSHSSINPIIILKIYIRQSMYTTTTTQREKQMDKDIKF